MQWTILNTDLGILRIAGNASWWRWLANAVRILCSLFSLGPNCTTMTNI